MQLKKSLYLVAILVLQGCMTCEEEADLFRERQCEMVIVKSDPHPGNNVFEIEGLDLSTGRMSRFEDVGGVYMTFTVQKGDTLMKKKGESSYHIWSSNGRRIVDFLCEGKVYK